MGLGIPPDDAAPPPPTVGNVLRGLVELLAPERCLGCDAARGDAPADPGMLAALAADAGVALDAFCGACVPLVERWRGIGGGDGADHLDDDDLDAAAFVYGGPLADGIVRMKHADRPELGDAFGRLLADAAGEWARRALVDAVVPVPSHRRRLRRRGYEVPALLARPLAARLGVPMRFDLLTRHRPTGLQRGRSPADRATNVRDAFRARPPPRGPSGPARGDAGPPGVALLVDDVRTSGATLAEAARCLRRDAGVGAVRTLVLAAR